METKLINLAYDVADEIKELPPYKRLLELKEIMDNNHEISSLITAFNKQKVKYEEVSKYGKYHPDLKKVQLELAVIKAEVYTHDVVKEYKEQERQLQKILNQVSMEIATSVSNKIKHPNEEGLIPKH